VQEEIEGMKAPLTLLLVYCKFAVLEPQQIPRISRCRQIRVLTHANMDRPGRSVLGLTVLAN
jgi:hypothetical protein